MHVASQPTRGTREREELAETIRPVIREELAKYAVTPGGSDPGS